MHSILNLANLSPAILTTQAPDSDADLWFVVAQGLLGILLLIGGWVINRLISQVTRLADRIDQFDKEHTARHNAMLVELTRVKSRVKHLEDSNA